MCPAKALQVYVPQFTSHGLGTNSTSVKLRAVQCSKRMKQIGCDCALGSGLDLHTHTLELWTNVDFDSAASKALGA